MHGEGRAVRDILPLLLVISQGLFPFSYFSTGGFAAGRYFNSIYRHEVSYLFLFFCFVPLQMKHRHVLIIVLSDIIKHFNIKTCQGEWCIILIKGKDTSTEHDTNGLKLQQLNGITGVH